VRTIGEDVRRQGSGLGCGWRSAGVLFKKRDSLGLAVFQDLKILFAEAGNGLIITVSHNHIRDNDAHVGFEGGSAIGGVRLGNLGLKRNYNQRRHNQPEEPARKQEHNILLETATNQRC
jgi:hypothetical protein